MTAYRSVIGIDPKLRAFLFLACALSSCAEAPNEPEPANTESVGATKAALTALKFTDQCEDELTSTDRSVLEQAFALVDDYEHTVESHINRSIARGTADSYTAISPERMDRWRDRVSEMRSGDIKIACAYNATSNLCNNSRGTFGQTLATDSLVWVRDRITVCVDNIRGRSDSDVALTAGTLAHELMHHVDGVEAHGPGGTTNPSNPQTAAETIGVAMEHLILTPDLRAKVRSLSSSFVNGRHELAVEVDVKNLNSRAGLDLTPVSNRKRNDSSNWTALSLAIDGAKKTSAAVPAIDALDSQRFTLRTSVPAYEAGADGSYELTVTADDADIIIERDEVNNRDTTGYSTEVDLSVSVEVAGEPTCHSNEPRPGTRTGNFSWFEVPYRVRVANLDRSTHAGRVDIVMSHDDMWSTSRVAAQKIQYLPELAPSGSADLFFSVDVPTNSACSGPSGVTQVSFVADGNPRSIFDKNRNNNTVSLRIDDAYWRPNYVVDLGSQQANGSAGSGAGMTSEPFDTFRTYSVRNIGPRRASSGTTLQLGRTSVIDPNGTTIFSTWIQNLAPAAQQSYDVEFAPSCDPITYTFVADSGQTVNESNENDNRVSVSISTPRVPSLDCAGADTAIRQCSLVCSYDVTCGTGCLVGSESTSCGEADEPCQHVFEIEPGGPFDNDDFVDPLEGFDDGIPDELPPGP